MRYIERDADATRYQGHQYAWIGWGEAYSVANRLRLSGSYGPGYAQLITSLPRYAPPQTLVALVTTGSKHTLSIHVQRDTSRSSMPLLKRVECLFRQSFRDDKILLNTIRPTLTRLRPVERLYGPQRGSRATRQCIEGAYFDCWRTDVHVLGPFEVPSDWTRFRSMDWGSARPFSVGWWAIVPDDYRARNVLGETVVLPRGALVRYREWYGCASTTKPRVETSLQSRLLRESRLERRRNSATGYSTPPALRRMGAPASPSG